MDKLTETYAFLGHYKEKLGNKNTCILSLFVPIVEKALYVYMTENNHRSIRGCAITEIRDKVFETSELKLPIPVLIRILREFESEVGDESKIKVYSDDAFDVKFSALRNHESLMKESDNSLSILERDFQSYCSLHREVVEFTELLRFIKSIQLESFCENQYDLDGFHYILAKYVDASKKNKEIFQIISEVYMGSIITSYLCLNLNGNVSKTELLIDTNFFISLINLNTEDAYTTCNDLYEYGRKMGFSFSILPSTVKQIKILLSNRIKDFALKNYIGTVRTADIYAACIRNKIDQTQLERLLDKVDETLETKGITVLKEAQVAAIVDSAKKSECYKILKTKRGNSESALNDAVAIEYVRKKRGGDADSFFDIKCWFLHNSYSTFYLDPSSSVSKKTSISASELLTLLWLSNPSQLPSVNEFARTGITNYITKYLDGKQPAFETIKKIKSRADMVVQSGKVTNRDVFALCTRMSEGSLNVEEIDNLSQMSDEEFSIYAAECEAAQSELVAKAQMAIEADKNRQELKKTIKNLDIELSSITVRIDSLNNQIRDLESEWEHIYVDYPKWILFISGGGVILLCIVNSLLDLVKCDIVNKFLGAIVDIFPLALGIGMIGWGLQLHFADKKRKEDAFLKWPKSKLLQDKQKELQELQSNLQELQNKREQAIRCI